MKECDWCEKPFTPKPNVATVQRFCSNKCRHASNRNEKVIEQFPTVSVKLGKS